MVAVTPDSQAPASIVGPDRRQQWNDFVTRHPHGHFMQLWEWGQLRSTTGWRPHYLAVEDVVGFKATALVLERAIPGFGTLFYTPRGPLWDPSVPGGLLRLARGVRALASMRRCVVWRTDPYVAEPEISFGFDLEAVGFRAVDMAWSYWNQPKYVMLLPLSAGKEGILRSLDRKDRYKIRHATKQGVVFEQAVISPPNITEFHRLMGLTAIKKGIPVREVRWYMDLLNVLGPSDRAALFFARKDQEAISAGISVRMGSKAWLLHLASDYSTGLANWGLMWEMVSWGIDSGCALYDFRGTATNYPPGPHDKGYGVYQFKKSFGAQLTPLLGYFDLVLAPMRYHAFRYAERRLLPVGERALEALAALRRMRAA